MSEDTDADDRAPAEDDSNGSSPDDQAASESEDGDASETATEFDAPTRDSDGDATDAQGEAQSNRTERGPEAHELLSEIRELEDRLESFESDIDQRTVSRNEVERNLRRYVRRRMRRGHARGWGPYLVLLYGTIMTLGAFYFLDGGWAVAAMIVIWLSTLGLYVLFVLFGAVLSLLNVPGRLYDRASRWRSR